MKFIVEKSSDWSYKDVIELDTLDELEKFIKSCGEDVVINEDFTTITIYDSYLE